MKQTEQSQRVKVTGILFTVVITIGFIWVVYRLAGLGYEKKPLTVEEMKGNEVRAFENLQAIARAQEAYKAKDWDSDGKFVYAMYYVHLWRSVTLKGEPIKVNLIPRELAIAMGNTKNPGGYYYVDLRRRWLDKETRKEFDYEREWGVVAQPGAKDMTGVMTLIVDQGGEIYATSGMHTEEEYPLRPVESGWTRVKSVEELKVLQAEVYKARGK